MDIVSDTKNSQIRFQLEVVNYGVKSMLQSRILLNEDQELILTHWRVLRVNKSVTDRAVAIGGIFCGVTGIIANHLSNNVWLGVFSSVSITCCGAYHAYKYFQLKYYKQSLNDLIKALHDVKMMFSDIKKYFRQRTISLESVRETQHNIFLYQLMREHEKEFALKFHKEFLSALFHLQGGIKSNITEMGMNSQTYKDLVDFNLSQFDVDADILIDNLLLKIEDIYDMYILLASAFLSSMVLKLSVNIWKSTKVFYTTIDGTVPKLLKNLRETLKQRSTFQVLKSLEQLEHIVKLPNHALVHKSHSIFTKHLDELLTQIQLVHQMAQSAKTSLEKNPNMEIQPLEWLMRQLISQLKKLNNYSDMLEILISKRNLPAIATGGSINESVISKTESRTSQNDTIRYDDPQYLPKEEEYELLIPAGGDSSEVVQYFNEPNYEQLKETAKHQLLLINELREKMALIKAEKMMTALQPNSAVARTSGSDRKIEHNCANPHNASLTSSSNGLVDRELQTMDISTPPPIPKCPKLPLNLGPDPVNNHSTEVFPLALGLQGNLAKAIANVALRMNREEETFGDVIQEDEVTDQEDDNIIT